MNRCRELRRRPLLNYSLKQLGSRPVGRLFHLKEINGNTSTANFRTTATWPGIS
jgi:hypothetical protein